MCVASAVTPVMLQQWPRVGTLEHQDAADMREILRRIDALDRKLGARDCAPDAAKETMLRQLDARIAELERRLPEAAQSVTCRP